MQQWTLVAVTTVAGYILLKQVLGRITRRRLASKAQQFRDKAQALNPELAAVDPVKERLILTSSALKLAALIRSGQVTSVEAVTVFIKRAITIGRKLRLTAEEAFATALIQAAACDEAVKTNPSGCGKLHGVPICVKDVFAEHGKATTCGVARLTDTVESEEALVLQILRAEGAILFLRSSVAQAVDWNETENGLFGIGSNPWDTERSCGGSGEAALVVALCAPLGISADQKDSMQLACAFNGAYGFRPTPDRVSHLGVRHSHISGISPYEWLQSTGVGPVAKSAEDLALVCQLWWQERMFRGDISLPELPFNHDLYRQTTEGKTLKIGVFRSNGLIAPIHGCSQRLEQAVSALRSLGHEVVDFPLPPVEQLFRLVTASVNASMLTAIEESLQGETPISAYINFSRFMCLRRLGFICNLLLRSFGENRLYESLKAPLVVSSAQAISTYYFLRDYRIAFTKTWLEAGLDAVVCPSWPCPAPRHGEIPSTMLALTYTSLWSLLGFPVGLVPTGPLNHQDLAYPETIKDSLTRGVLRHCENAEGLPMSLAVVGLPYMDEKVLGVVRVLEQAQVARFLPTIN